MLGQRDYIVPLDSVESRKIRETTYGIATGNLNEEDRALVAYFESLTANNKNRFIWK